MIKSHVEMGGKLISLFLIQVFIAQVFTISLHPAVTQYLLSGLSNPTPQPVVKTIPAKPSAAPSFQTIAALVSLLASSPPTSCPKSAPQTFLPLSDLSRSLSPNILSSLPTDLTKSLTPTTIATLTDYLNSYTKSQIRNTSPTTSLESLYSTFPALDASFLNSLVLAIQLLLLTNILSSSPELALEGNVPASNFQETPAVTYAQPATPLLSQSQPSAQSNTYYPYYEHQSYSMPNANFLGSSSFMDSNPIMSSVSYPSSSRNGLALMSPYEALSPSSPYSDPILSSSYGSYSKRDFQSPYMAILASEPKDSFTFNDFF